MASVVAPALLLCESWGSARHSGGEGKEDPQHGFGRVVVVVVVVLVVIVRCSSRVYCPSAMVFFNNKKRCLDTGMLTRGEVQDETGEGGRVGVDRMERESRC